MELGASANKLDLRFIADDVEIQEKAKLLPLSPSPPPYKNKSCYFPPFLV